MKHLKVLLFIVISAFYLFSHLLNAQTTKDTIQTKSNAFVILKDNPIVAALDSLSVLKCFQKSNFATDVKNLNKYKYAVGDVPAFGDSVYNIRIAKLNAKSPFGLVYNEDVEAFINLYAVKKRQMTSRILGLSEYYFPLFETYLDKYHLPLELKYLAVVESALNSVAKSSAGANGLWQFIYSTGKMYGLQVTSYTDDRCDPLKATIAACEHFRDLFAIYKDWSLVLAAYNSGPGNVNKAIRKANGEMDFWKIKKYLPRETQGYVPAFIAVTYVMNYAAEHNLYPVAPVFMSYDIDTVTVKQKLTFAQISEALNISLEDITYLNPCYKESVIPAFGDEKYPLYLPKKHIGDFITNEVSIYNFKTKAMLEEEKILAEKQKEIHRKDSLLALQKQHTYKKKYATINKIQDTVKNDKTTAINAKTENVTTGAVVYTVKSGDYLGNIASKHNCTINQLQAWNKMKSINIYPGQKLYVQDPSLVADIKVKNSTPANSQNAQVKYLYYIVQKGDTLWGIASRYKGVTVEEIQRLNNLSGKAMLYVGQKLKVAVGS
ncbi:MAG: LysM peptidoglycan-binding domain-containing protein [Bacteroidales bacterium]